MSKDGTRVAFGSTRKGPTDLYIKLSSGASAEQLLLSTPNAKRPRDWSPDGRFLLYTEDDPKTSRDLWALPMTGSDRTPVRVATTVATESNGQFSPDGRFVAYETNESGRFEIVVQAFPQPSGKWQVSLAGGTQPRWRADGKELYFIGADGKMMAAQTTIGSDTLLAAAPTALFAADVVTGGGADKQQYAVARDGRFLVIRPVESAPEPITLLLNWRPKS